jgi:hypothetical protein
MNKKKLKEVAGELEKASKMHAGQAKKIKSMLKYKKSGPFKMKSPLKAKAKGLDGKACWKGYKLGNPKTKMKGGKRVDNCVKA